MLVLSLAHVLLRDRLWVHEWTWASFQYQFATIFSVPVVVGLSCWEAAAWSGTSDARRLAGRTLRGSARRVTRLGIWAAVGHLVGGGLVVALVVAAGTPPPTSPGPALVFVPALALLVLGVALGWVLGWRLPRPVVAPLAAIAAFGCLLGATLVVPERVTRVGGATASLSGSQVRPATSVAQAAAYLGLAVLVVVVGGVRRRGDVGLGAVGAAVVGAVVSCLPLAGAPSPVLEPARTTLQCAGSDPEICLTAGYVHLEPRLRVLVEPTLDALDRAGLARPARMVEVLEPDAVPGWALITPTELLRYGPAVAPSMVTTAHLRGGCDPLDPRVRASFTALSSYLSAARHRPTWTPSPERRTDLQQAVEVLDQCGGR